MLLVEDNELVAEGIRFGLAYYGFDVAVMHDGYEAISCMTAEAPEVIVVDLSLPDVDGVLVAEMARRGWPEIPVIIISGLEEPLGIVTLLLDRQTAFLQKPFGVDSLVAAIEGRMPYS